jgi:hypothetical protein
MSKSTELKSIYGAKIKANNDINAFELQYGPDSFDSPDTLSVIRFQGRQNGIAWLRPATEFQPETIEDNNFMEVPNPDYPAFAKASKIFFEKFGNSPQRVIDHHIEALLSLHRKQRAEEMKSAEVEGKKAAGEFLKILFDVNHDRNAEAVARYKTEFNSCLFEIEPAFVEALYKKNGYTRPPVRDLEYEASLTRGFAPADAVEESILQSLVKLFELKWAATASYKGDREVYDIFLKENLPISGTPTFKPRK